MSEFSTTWEDLIADAFARGDEEAGAKMAQQLRPANGQDLESIKADIAAASLGDEDAANRLATRISGGRPMPKNIDPDYVVAAYHHARDPANADVLADPEMYAELADFDSKLAVNAPHLLPAQRLAIATQAVRNRGTSDDRSAADGMQILSKGRNVVHTSVQAEVSDQEDRDRSEVLQEMMAARARGHDDELARSSQRSVMAVRAVDREFNQITRNRRPG